MKNMMVAVVTAAMVSGSASAWAGEGCGPVKGACAMSKSRAPAAAESVPAYGKIDGAALKKLVDSKTPVVIIDARSAQWDDGKRIPGAISLTTESPEDAVSAALPSKDALIVAYCSNLKCPASAKLAERLVGLGYKNVLKYPEGLEGWIQSGNEITGGEAAQ